MLNTFCKKIFIDNLFSHQFKTNLIIEILQMHYKYVTSSIKTRDVCKKTLEYLDENLWFEEFKVNIGRQRLLQSN